jgi:hypothetical protein
MSGYGQFCPVAATEDLVNGVPRRRIVVASMIGTTIEFYDFYI